MGEQRVGIIMNGVTGRMGSTQHLARSIIPLREQGGIVLEDGRVLVPEPILVGRNERKLAELASRWGVARWTTDLEAALADADDTVYFDAQITELRAAGVRAAIAAGKHVYCEKPVAHDLDTALELARLARDAGVRNGVVQDKLFLPGLRKLRRLVDSGFFGRIAAVRGEFGYWVFDGRWQPPQRPSWNYRREDGGGIVLDMFPHWRYVLDHVVAPVRSVLCHAATHIPERLDERGEPYDATAEDAAYAMFELEGDVVVQLNSSWVTRVHRDELLELHVDGTDGSAVAGLWGCRIQHRVETPRAVWDPDAPETHDYRGDWQRVPDDGDHDNAFRAQWERFLRHVADDEPFPWDLLEGAKGVQLAELAHRSWRERRWVDVPPLET